MTSNYIHNGEELEEEIISNINFNRPRTGKTEESERQNVQKKTIEVSLSKRSKNGKNIKRARNKSKSNENNSESEKDIKNSKSWKGKIKKTFLKIKRERTSIENDKKDDFTVSPLQLPAKVTNENFYRLHSKGRSNYDLDTEKEVLPKSDADYNRKKDLTRKKLKNELVSLISITILLMKLKEKLIICSKNK